MRKQELHPHTAVMNTKQKNKAKKARMDALAWLADKFPKAFDTSIQIQPLKVGIMADILVYADEAQAAGISKSKLREAVVLFTRRIDYLTCLKARGMRIDLQGNPISQVSDDDVERAVLKIKKRVEKSAKNARKNAATKPAMNTKKSSQPTYSQSGNEFSYYTDRTPAYAMPNQAEQAARSASVVVTHKQARQYDPSAVARLKEKLGLSRASEKKESVD